MPDIGALVGGILGDFFYALFLFMVNVFNGSLGIEIFPPQEETPDS